MNQSILNKTRKETAQVCKKRNRTRKKNKNGNRHGNFEPSLKSKITSTENSIRAYSIEKRILTIPEEFKHTELSEIISK